MSSSRSALIVANRLPFPVDDGWKSRAFQVTRALGAAMETTLLAFDTAPGALDDARRTLGPAVTIRTVPAPRARTPAKLALGLLTRDPLHVWNARSRAMLDAARDIVERRKPTVAVFESPYVYPIAAALPPGTCRVIDAHNVENLIFSRYARTLGNVAQRWYAGITARKLARFERESFSSADVAWLCSAQDRDLARQLAPAADLRVVPNGVDTQAFQPGQASGRNPLRLLYFGKLDYLPNVDAIEWFTREIFPVIRKRMPGITLDIAGAGATGSIEDIVRGVPGINLLGRLDDVRPALASAGVVVVPLRIGGGTRLKIVEALAMACPLVSTPIGAEGLEVQDGRDLLLAGSPGSFAQAIERLVADRALADALGAQGRATVAAHYDWGKVLARAIAELPRDRRQGAA